MKKFLINLLKFAGVILMPAIIFYVVMYIDSFASNSYVEYFSMRINTLRLSTNNFLFKIAPFLITITIAITTLTINTYSGTYLNLIIKNRSTKNAIYFFSGYIVFHSLVIFFIDSSMHISNLSQEDHQVKYFVVYTTDFILALISLILVFYTAYKIFLYSWPATLKNQFTKDIKNTIKIMKKSSEQKTENRQKIDEFSKDLNEQIGLFINLISKAIKSKDYDGVKDIFGNIQSLWIGIVTNKNDEKQNFEKMAEEATQEESQLDKNNQTGLDEYAGDTYEIGLSKIAHVYSESFEIAFSNGEYHACEIIINSVYDLAYLKNADHNDIRKCLKILLGIYYISLRFDKKGQTEFFTQKILSNVAEIYKETDFISFEIYYDMVLYCLKLDEHKILKETLSYFKISFIENSLGKKAVYESTINIFHSTLVYSLKNKRMKCFAELVKFFVVENIDLKIINEVFSKKIILAKEKLDDFEEMYKELDEDYLVTDDNYYGNYYNLKSYIIWYGYYLLQVRISPERIYEQNRDLCIPSEIKNKVSFEMIRTVLLDLETHRSKWNKLFVGQEEYYSCLVSAKLLEEDNFDRLIKEIEEFGESDYLNKVYENLNLVDRKSKRLNQVCSLISLGKKIQSIFNT